MNINRAWIARIFASLALVGVSFLGTCGPAAAAQLLATKGCKFVMHVPGVFGGTNLHLMMRKGAVFTENTDHKFCGPVAQATPFGESNDDQCFIIRGGKLVSGKWSDKVTSSNCHLANADAMGTPFSVANFSAWAGTGPSTLSGQAFLRTVGGDVKTCAGARVTLLPAAPYVKELIAKERSGIAVRADPRLMAYVRRTICDAQGNFSLKQLPAKRWYVITRVTWGVPHIAEPESEPGPLASILFGIHASAEIDKQGGELLKIVALTPGDNQVVLTYRDAQ